MIKKLNEDTSLKFKTISPEEKSKKGILGRLYGNVASFAAPTRNGRRYSQELWQKLFDSPLIKERFANGGIFGELCHPDYEDVNMEKVAIVMPEPPVKDNDGNLVAYVDIVDTPCGRIAYQLAKYGYKFGISSRGSGDIIEDYNGNEEVDPDTYQLNAFDLVEIPAVESARLQFVESLDTKKRYGKTLKEELVNELNKASEEDKKIMSESLKNLDIKLDEKLVEPSEEDLAPIEAKFAELGLEVEGKGKTLFGNVHYQLRKELDHKVTKDDLGPIFDELCDLDTPNLPTVCNVGIHRDGDNIISASVDVLQKQVTEALHNKDRKTFAKALLDANTENDLFNNIKEIASYDKILGRYLLKINKEGGSVAYRAKKMSDFLTEELQNTDGWGDHIQGQLEQTFGNLEDLMYEVRNAVRGSYAVNGDTVQDLVGELRDLADQLSMNADDLEFDQDSLNETAKLNKEQVSEDGCSNKKDVDEAFNPHGYTNVINAINDGIEDDTDTEALQDYLQNIVGYCRSIANDYDILLESVSDIGCSDKEDQVVEENAGNSGEDLMKELQDALSKNGELEKDNLSLQEKLSVCNAKEIKLNEELSKYKKVSSSLSDTAKKVKSLEEEVENLNSQLDYKDKLIESKNDRLSKLITFKKENISKLNESDSKISDLESRVKSLSESVSNSNKKLADATALVKKYQRALKESRDRYIDAKALACGLSADSVRAQLKESYNYKDIDSVCDKLVEQKVNMSKLPFRLNEGAQLKAKSSQNEYIRGNRMPDDDVSDYLLSMIK